MLRLLLGILKGGVLGAGVGLGAHHLELGPGWNWVVYGAVGLVVGLFVGRPVWSHLFDAKSTVWTGILKGIFGFGIGVGLWALGSQVAPDPQIAFQGTTKALSQWTPLFGGLVGLLYGAWVELDDPPEKRVKEEKTPS